MTNSVKPPGHPAHKASWVALALAAVTLAGQIFGWWTDNHPSGHQVKQAAAPVAAAQAKATVHKLAERALNQAANAAPPAAQPCNLPLGQGTMGGCAPRASAGISKLALTSSVTTIRGHLIGADVSSYQGCQTHFQLAFVITKATESTGYTDRCLAPNVAAAKRSGVTYGEYDFLRPGRTSASAEAQHFISAVKVAGADGIPVADVEANDRHLSAATVHAYVCQWVSDVRAALHHQPVIYTGNWFWGPQVGGNDCGAPLWISAYASYAQLPAAWGGGTLNPASGYNSRAPLWQYSDGVYGPYPRIQRWDTDVWFGTRAQLADLAGASKPCSARTACRMGRRHAHVHRTIVAKCHGAPAASHRKVCRTLRSRNSYMHRYARRHHLPAFTTR